MSTILPFRSRVYEMSEVDRMEGHAFEYYCAELLRYDGFIIFEVTKGSGDQGVDIIAYKAGERYAIQCKRYHSPLGNTPVQEVYTGCAVHHCTKAIVLTNSTFTKGAYEAAAKTGVILWDRQKLEMLIRAKQARGAQGIAGGRGAGLFAVCLVLALLGAFLYWRHRPPIQSPRHTAVLQTVAPASENDTGTSRAVSAPLTFTVTKMAFSRHNGNLDYQFLVEDSIINCCVYVTVENIGEAAVDLNEYDAVLLCDGTAYAHNVMEDKAFLFHYPSVDPSVTLYNKVINFHIPKEEMSSDSEIVLVILSPEGQQTAWKLR